MRRYGIKNSALFLAVAAMFVAILTGGKQALSFIPNVEIVSIIVAVCGYVWGMGMALPVTVAFTLVQMAFYGFNNWVLEYLVYWPLLAACFWGLSKAKIRSIPLEIACATVLAVICTIFFGVFTSAVDTVIAFVGGKFKVVVTDYASRFATMYLRGIAFYVAQIVSNTVFFVVGFRPLVVVNRKAKQRLFPTEDETLPQSQTNSKN